MDFSKLLAWDSGRRIACKGPRYALTAGLGAGIFEELGWTGFATPRLLRRHSWLVAGFLIGLPWGLWHALPDYLGGRVYGPMWLAHIVEWIVALVAFRVLMTWSYSRTNSLFLGMLLHASFTGGQASLWPTAASPQAELVWYGAFSGLINSRPGVVRADRQTQTLSQRSVGQL